MITVGSGESLPGTARHFPVRRLFLRDSPPQVHLALSRFRFEPRSTADMRSGIAWLPNHRVYEIPAWSAMRTFTSAGSP